MDVEVFGLILSELYEAASHQLRMSGYVHQEEDLPCLPGVYEGSLEQPLHFSPLFAGIRFMLEYIEPPTSKILVNPLLVVEDKTVSLEEVRLFECTKPGMIYKNTLYRFPDQITRLHLKNLKQIRDITIPEPLFGAFVENSLPELGKYAEIANQQVIENFVTIPFIGKIEAICDLSYLNGELEAVLYFVYEGNKIPIAPVQVKYEHINSFVKKEGILARNLVEERKIVEDLFQDFTYLSDTGVYISKSDKKIVEFMTEIIPRNQGRVEFKCPQNLLDQFIYDQTEFVLRLKDTDKIDSYEIDLEVNGSLHGVRVDTLWECMATRKSFIELDMPKSKGRKVQEGGRLPKILVLDLDRISGIVKLFDELGSEILENHTLKRPLWGLASLDAEHFEGLPITFTITEQLMDIRRQMLGEKQLMFSEVPSTVKATLRSYQLEGVKWLERLRSMYLSGILADDMGLGKTLQAIVTISQYKKASSGPALIVCPTSLLYNWK
ncbi:MAG: DEAD/DEAH box helicase, partial [Verrucomicrobia bacterium]|nr:DEAD/DEAH box helicase [Verrucomicrobiota bacterium]